MSPEAPRSASGSDGRAGRSSRLRTLDGVIMLSPDGRPAAGAFPDNVWIVMGTDDDSIEDFFGPSGDVLMVGMSDDEISDDTAYCVGFDMERRDMVMNGAGSYPVLVSGLLRAHRGGLE